MFGSTKNKYFLLKKKAIGILNLFKNNFKGQRMSKHLKALCSPKLNTGLRV